MNSDILLQIGLSLPIKSLFNYLLVYRVNNNFWKLRMEQDYPKVYSQLKIGKLLNYKLIYRNNYWFKDKITQAIYVRPEFVGEITVKLTRGDMVIRGNNQIIYDGKKFLPFTTMHHGHEVVNQEFRIIEEFELTFCYDVVPKARFDKLLFYFSPAPYLEQIIKNEHNDSPYYKSWFYDFRNVQRYIQYRKPVNFNKDSWWRVTEFNIYGRVYKYGLMLVVKNVL